MESDSNPLSAFADILPGTSPKGQDINSLGLGLPFFQGAKEFGALNPTAERFTERPVRTALKGDILVSVRAPVGRINIADSDCAIGRGVMAVRPKEGDHADFLFYVLRGMEGKWGTHGTTGSVFESLSTAGLKELPVPVIKASKIVGAILASLDDKIRLNTEISKSLEAIAQTIFKSWFIDFDPVHAKMRGEKPEGMDDATAALFPDSFEESELGLIPKGWEVKSLDAIARFLNGLALQKFPPHDGSDNLPVIKIAQLRAGNTTGADFASKQIKSEYIIKDGDILFSWSGTLEVEYWTGGDGALNQHLFKVTGNTVPDWFAFLATRYFLEDFRSIARSKATTMGHIQRGHLTEAKMPLADTGLLGVADSIISPLIELLVSKRIEANQLAALRDALLPRLISGELEIPDEMLVS